MWRIVIQIKGTWLPYIQIITCIHTKRWIEELYRGGLRYKSFNYLIVVSLDCEDNVENLDSHECSLPLIHALYMFILLSLLISTYKKAQQNSLSSTSIYVIFRRGDFENHSAYVYIFSFLRIDILHLYWFHYFSRWNLSLSLIETILKLLCNYMNKHVSKNYSQH